MAASEQGVALALSLGGRAATVAQHIPHEVLEKPYGLSYLIYRLEMAFAQEEQDVQQSRFNDLRRLQRRRGESGRDFKQI